MYGILNMHLHNTLFVQTEIKQVIMDVVAQASDLDKTLSEMILNVKLIYPYCHLYASVTWVSIGSGNGLSPVRSHAISWTDAAVLLIGPLGTHFNEFRRKYKTFHPWKYVWKCLPKWRPFCPGERWINIQYILRNMHTVTALLCFVVVIHWLIFTYPSDLLHWHCGNLTIAPVPAKQPWWIWINISCEFIMNDCITTTKQSTTKPCAYFVGYTVGRSLLSMKKDFSYFGTSVYCHASFDIVLSRLHCIKETVSHRDHSFEGRFIDTIHSPYDVKQSLYYTQRYGCYGDMLYKD